MKKTLIALALVSLPVAASADVILYGQIKGGVEVNRAFTKGLKDNGKVGTATRIVDYGSRIGFKGHEDLSDNLRAIWQLEQSVNIGGGKWTDKHGNERSSGFGSRESFIGLDGGFGTVKVGHLDTPVKQVNGRLDNWEYADNAAGLGTYTRGNAAVKRAVAVSYDTPNFAGFKAQAYVSPSDNNNGNSEADSFFGHNKDADKALYGAKLGYENAGFFADLAGTYVKNAPKTAAIYGKNHDGYQAVANVGYDANNWLAGVSYQQGRYVDNINKLIGESAVPFTGDIIASESDTTGSVIKRSQEVAATVGYTINNAVRVKGSAAYGFGIKGDGVGAVVDDSGNVTGTEAYSFDKLKYMQGVVGADYLLSKRTTLNGQVGYLEFRGAKNDDGSRPKLRRGVVGVGMKHKF